MSKIGLLKESVRLMTRAGHKPVYDGLDAIDVRVERLALWVIDRTAAIPVGPGSTRVVEAACMGSTIVPILDDEVKVLTTAFLSTFAGVE